MSATNMLCSFCGHRWHAAGNTVEDLLCFRCQGWLPDKDGKLADPEGLKTLTEGVIARVRSNLARVKP